MSNKIEPCLCGGNVKTALFNNFHWIYCEKCQTATYHFRTEREAVVSWNKLQAAKRAVNCKKEEA